jgi:hypothetical protein
VPPSPPPAVVRKLTWVNPGGLRNVSIDRWIELPGWIPPDRNLLDSDRGTPTGPASGQRCRPVAQTVIDTWEWMTVSGSTCPSTHRRYRDWACTAKQEAALAEWRAQPLHKSVT